MIAGDFWVEASLLFWEKFQKGAGIITIFIITIIVVTILTVVDDNVVFSGGSWPLPFTTWESAVQEGVNAAHKTDQRDSLNFCISTGGRGQGYNCPRISHRLDPLRSGTRYWATWGPWLYLRSLLKMLCEFLAARGQQVLWHQQIYKSKFSEVPGFLPITWPLQREYSDGSYQRESNSILENTAGAKICYLKRSYEVLMRAPETYGVWAN